MAEARKAHKAQLTTAAAVAESRRRTGAARVAERVQERLTEAGVELQQQGRRDGGGRQRA